MKRLSTRTLPQKQFVPCVEKTAFSLACLITSLVVIGDFGLMPTAEAGNFQAANSREVREIRAEIRAAQFLSKATFGPTKAEIDDLAADIKRMGVRRACGKWIDSQMDPNETPMTLNLDVVKDILDEYGQPYAQDQNDQSVPSIAHAQRRYYAWFDTAVRGPDQLRQRVAYALSQICVIGDSGTNFDSRHYDGSDFDDPSVPLAKKRGRWMGMSDFYDEVCVKTAFGNYKEALQKMTFHPCMGIWLSHLRNKKANIAQNRFPDENYAREIMQLFSIGLYEMHEDGRWKTDSNGEFIPTYDNETIKTFARVFTGLTYNSSPNFNYGTLNLTEPMEMWGVEHDNNRNYSEDPTAPQEKRLFAGTPHEVLLPSLNETVTDQQGEDEVYAAIDGLFAHPNVAPFISRLLIQRLVKSNPSRGYIRRVARKFNNNGQGVKGDMKAVVKAIFLDPELFRGQRLLRRRNPSGSPSRLRVEVLTRGTEFSRLREPVLRMTAIIRSLTDPNDVSDEPNDRALISSYQPESDFGQVPFGSPTVFNFYLPDHQPAGELLTYQPSRRNPYGAVFAPEFEILNAVTANKTINVFRGWCWNMRATGYIHGSLSLPNNRVYMPFDVADDLQAARTRTNLEGLFEKYDLLLCNGTLGEDAKQAVLDAIDQYAANDDNDGHAQARLQNILLFCMISPDAAIDE